jgi:uncharacterized protein
MRITFDLAKDASNQEKHGVSLAELRGSTGVLVVQDTRHEYGEDRYRGIALLGGRLHSVVFTPRDETMRIISLRKASNTEIDAYEQS